VASRREARQCAIMVLCGMDASSQGPELAWARFWDSFDEAGLDVLEAYSGGPVFDKPMRIPPRSDVEAFAWPLLEGVFRNRVAIDELLAGASENWRVDRMSPVDRNVLRVGVFELIYRTDEVPKKVVINEAVEIAKFFGASESTGFVNGILDSISRRG
jgi:transcription antitermination protein NusB